MLRETRNVAKKLQEAIEAKRAFRDAMFDVQQLTTHHHKNFAEHIFSKRTTKQCNAQEL